MTSRIVGTYTSVCPFHTEFYQYATPLPGFLQSAPLPLPLVPEATEESCPANATLFFSGKRHMFTGGEQQEGVPAQSPVLLDVVHVNGMTGLINAQSSTFKSLTAANTTLLRSHVDASGTVVRPKLTKRIFETGRRPLRT